MQTVDEKWSNKALELTASAGQNAICIAGVVLYHDSYGMARAAAQLGR